MVAHALAWIDKHPRGPFFVWIHLYDPHAPYDPPEPFRSKYASDPYDGARKIQWTRLHHVRGLFSELVQEVAKDFVAHDSGIGKGLALRVEHAGGRLIDVIELAKSDVFLDGGIRRTAFDECANLGHFRGG